MFSVAKLEFALTSCFSASVRRIAVYPTQLLAYSQCQNSRANRFLSARKHDSFCLHAMECYKFIYYILLGFTELIRIVEITCKGSGMSSAGLINNRWRRVLVQRIFQQCSYAWVEQQPWSATKVVWKSELVGLLLSIRSRLFGGRYVKQQIQEKYKSMGENPERLAICIRDYGVPIVMAYTHRVLVY